MNKPNIIFVLIDDIGWKDLGCTGSRYYETPHLDRLAGEGIRFENAYAAGPVCAPSRGAIYSGKNPGRTKYTTVCGEDVAADDRLYETSKFRGGNNQHYEARHRHTLPSTEMLFAEPLTDAGYTTGFFGKWHCGNHPDYTPDRRGFEVAKGYRKRHVPTGTSGHWGETFDRFAANMEVTDDEYVSDALTDECAGFIRKNKDQPFMAVLSHYLVHMPIQAKPEKRAYYEKKPTTDQDNPGYAAMVESVDESVGQLMRVLEELDIADNTMVVFTSDNGGYSPHATSNYPLLGGKSFPFEAGMKVPLIIRWPDVLEPGRVTAERTIAMDFYPTFLEAAGADLRPGQHADGISLMPLLTGAGAMPERPLIFHYPHYTGAMGPASSIIEGEWKLIHFYNDEQGGYLLFNIEKDPYEQNDLCSDKPEIVKRLAGQLDRELEQMDAEFPIPNPNYDPDSSDLRNRETTYRLANEHRRVLEEKLRCSDH